MSYNNNGYQQKQPQDANLPQVFQRLGSSAQSPLNNNKRLQQQQQQQRRQDPRNIKKTIHLQDHKPNNSGNFPSFPDYSTITRMNEEVLRFTPSNENNLQGFNGYTTPPKQSFNFVRNEPILTSPPQEITRPFTFLKAPIAANNMNGNFNYFNNQQQQHFNQQLHHMNGVTAPIVVNKNTPVQDNTSHHQRKNSSNNINNNTVIEDKPSSSSSKLDAIAKKIKIVTNLQKDKNYDSDTSMDFYDEKETVVAKRKITVTTPKRNRSSSRERSPIKRSKRPSVSPSRRKRRHSTSSSDDSNNNNKRNARLCRRPRRKTTNNHNDSDEDLAPFLRGEYDHYNPDYDDGDSDRSIEKDVKNGDINARLSKKMKDASSATLSINSRPSSSPTATSPTATSPTATATVVSVPTTPVKELRSYPALGTSDLKSPTTSASHHKVWVNTGDKPVHKTSPASILASGPLPPSKKFTLVKSQSTTKPVLKSSPVPLSHKIITASKTIVPPVKSPLSKAPSVNENNKTHAVSKNNATLKNPSSTANNYTSVSTDKNGINKCSNNDDVNKVNNSLSPDKIIAKNATPNNVKPKDSPGKEQTKANNNISPEQALKEKREQEAKDLLRRLDIDDREDVVMDVVPVISSNGQNVNKVLLKNKHCPQKTIKVEFKQEPTAHDTLDTPSNDDNEESSSSSTLVSSAEEIFQKVFQEALDTVSQLSNQLKVNEKVTTPPPTTNAATATATATATRNDTPLQPILAKAESPSPEDIKKELMVHLPTTLIHHTRQTDFAANQDTNLPSPPTSATLDNSVPLPIIPQNQENDTVVKSPNGKKKNARLPPPWKVMLSDGEIYYRNPVTGEIRTERPVA